MYHDTTTIQQKTPPKCHSRHRPQKNAAASAPAAGGAQNDAAHDVWYQVSNLVLGADKGDVLRVNAGLFLSRPKRRAGFKLSDYILRPNKEVLGMVFYFTGTGNNLYAAQYIDKEAVSIPQRIKNYPLTFTAERIGIVCPVYGHEMPVKWQPKFEQMYFKRICKRID